MKTIIVIGISIVLGIVCGSGSVYAFNHIPDEWLGADEKGREWQRVKSVPWKYILTATFIVTGIYLGISDVQKAAGIYAACLFITQIAMAAFLYDRVPRPLVFMLALTGAGIIPFTISEDLGFGAGTYGMIKARLLGAVIGFAVMTLFAGLKKLITESSKDGKITADDFFQTAEFTMVLGLLCGWKRILTVISCGIIAWAAYVLFKKIAGGGIINGKRKIEESFFIAVSAFVWMLIGAGLSIQVV